MERNYQQRFEASQLETTGAFTIQYLLQYSRSLRVVHFGGINFETNLN